MVISHFSSFHSLLPNSIPQPASLGRDKIQKQIASWVSGHDLRLHFSQMWPMPCCQVLGHGAREILGVSPVFPGFPRPGPGRVFFLEAVSRDRNHLCYGKCTGKSWKWTKRTKWLSLVASCGPMALVISLKPCKKGRSKQGYRKNVITLCPGWSYIMATSRMGQPHPW